MTLSVYFILALAAVPWATAFAPVPVVRSRTTSSTELYSDVSRRDLLLTVASGIAVVVAAPEMASAKGSTFFYDEKIENVREASQMPTNGKVDLNSAFVVRDSWESKREHNLLSPSRLFINGRFLSHFDRANTNSSPACFPTRLVRLPPMARTRRCVTFTKSMV